ncbi:hypothetical protein [Methylobacterium oryzisoli]|uniref:hypothetical protein n=1 Tax=Methylobacterium oryzisoli TaxID=3385502 RepID=UPI003892133E
MLDKLDPVALLTAAGPILIAFVTGWFAWVAGKKKASTEAQVAITSGFEVLIRKLQEERTELTKIIDRQATALDRQADKIDGLEAEVRGLQRHIDRLEKAMRDANVDVPALPNRG